MAVRPFVLGRLSAVTFLERYWQREPVVIRRAFAHFSDPLSTDELAGLACESNVDSRLVLRRGGRKPWEVIRGPQKPAVLRRLPRSHWTLLVESVDRHDPAVAHLADAFSFLPKWRMDDVMISLAPVKGGVDAHIDSYDVFLIQGQGRRVWEVDRLAKPDYRPGLDLRILRKFVAQDRWTLEPGDMLYVPPGVAHRGTTVKSDAEIALTYSIGFRAPSSTDLMSSLVARALAKDAPRLFGDAGRAPARDRFEITSADAARLHEFAVSDLPAAESDDWVLAVGEAVTAGGGAGRSRRSSASEVARRLRVGNQLAPAAPARISWSRLRNGRSALFINGESRVFSRKTAFVPPLLCGDSARPSTKVRPTIPRSVLESVAEMLKLGLLTWNAPTRDVR